MFRPKVKGLVHAISFRFACLLALIFFLALASAIFLPVHSQLKDPNLTVETVVTGFETPIAMAFLDQDMLVIEKDTGRVHRIQNGEISGEPLLDIKVATQVERGLLGIAVSRNVSEDRTYVFLYYTEAEKETGEGQEDNDRDGAIGGEDEPLGNRLYRYELSEDGTKLVNPKLLLDLPYEPGPAHNGGTIAIGGPDDNNNVCVVIGNLEVPALNDGIGNNLAQNVQDGDEPDGRAGIICVTQDGQKISFDNGREEGITEGGGILGNEHPLDMYYAYGIRNRFGLTFDPLTGNLWDTENGGYDEINLVEPGFNSGFSVITGSSEKEVNDDRFDGDDLVDFDGKGKYSDPELDSGSHMVPTAIVFLHSDRLGAEYENDMFVAMFRGLILHFDLNEDRNELLLEGDLADKIADTEEELEAVTFGEDMGYITDLKVGPDGYLYAVDYHGGDIIRIIPEEENEDGEEINDLQQ